MQASNLLDCAAGIGSPSDVLQLQSEVWRPDGIGRPAIEELAEQPAQEILAESVLDKLALQELFSRK